MQALPQAAFFLLAEAAVGGTITLLWVHLRGEVSRGFTLFTGVSLLIVEVLAIWLRSAFPPPLAIDRTAALWLDAERVLSLAFAIALGVYLIGLRAERWRRFTAAIAPLVPLLGLASLWCAALVAPGPQLLGLGAPLAVLAGALALGSAVTGLSLGHWYLVSPTLSVRPLIQLTFVCLGALLGQIVLLPVLLLAPGPAGAGRVQLLFSEYALFFGVRVVFGLAVPLAASVMTWRTARIRSLDSATGLLYIVAALVLAGEIAARTLFFLTGVAT